jgi:hypothetical protein
MTSSSDEDSSLFQRFAHLLPWQEAEQPADKRERRRLGRVWSREERKRRRRSIHATPPTEPPLAERIEQVRMDYQVEADKMNDPMLDVHERALARRAKRRLGQRLAQLITEQRREGGGG